MTVMFGILGAIGVLLMLALAKSWFYIVGGKEVAILQTLGKPHEQGYGPGLHLKLPWPITTIHEILTTQIQQIEAKVAIKTKDNVFMTLPTKVQFRVDDDLRQAVKASYELEDPIAQVEAYVLNSIRSTAAGMDMADIFSNRDKIENAALRDLTGRFKNFGYIIENVLLDQPRPPANVEDSFNKVIASQRLKEAAVYEAEAIRERLVGAAKAESESKKLQGEGMAAMREAIAKGLEVSMETLKKTGLTAEQATAFLTDTNRLDTMNSVASHGNVMILDIANGSVFGQTLGALKAAKVTPKGKH